MKTCSISKDHRPVSCPESKAPPYGLGMLSGAGAKEVRVKLETEDSILNWLKVVQRV